jgi:UDP-N-acetylmuramoyl-L-alanyl-D-glutamate--2,6-diaminopimelate ligase
MNRAVRRLAKSLKRLTPQWLFDLIDPLGHGLEAYTAALTNGFPGRQLRIIGITGTNGKTSTAAMTAKIFEAAGYRVGLSTTAIYQVGDEHFANDRNATVTDPWDLQKLLKRMRQAKVEVAVLEVTSHALAQNRIAGINFEAVALTNITQDHLDYHRTMDRYRLAKAKLFQRPGIKLSVLNVDDSVYERFSHYPAARHISYSLEQTASLRAKDIEVKGSGTHFELDYQGKSVTVQLHLPGRFNVANALAAAGLALGLGVPIDRVVMGLEQLDAIPGRMEPIKAGQSFTVIVDYAHTPDALENLYTTLRSITKGRLIVILGAAGDRDRVKRPIMGKLAAKLCDYVILTDEEAYSEDPASIIAAIEPGVKAGGGVRGKTYEIVPDRRAAIERAFKLANANDTVALTGMGHQQYRIAKGVKTPWDERQVARELLGARADGHAL